MVFGGYVLGSVDFTSSLSLSQVADLLSSKIFGGICFVEKDVEEDYDLGTLCLAYDFMGIQVDLLGEEGRFTIEIGTRPSASVEEINEVCDFSEMLKQFINELDELHLS